MTDPTTQTSDLIQALRESTDASNRLAAVTQRNIQAISWLAAVLQWSKAPWWRRGKAPRWPL
jgi:hypothetical protein